MSLLAVSVQFYGRPSIVAHIKAGAFYPVPKVDSAIVRIVPYSHPAVEVADRKQFFAVVKAGFSQKRKQLHNALAAGLARPQFEIVAALERAGLDGRRRAQRFHCSDVALRWLLVKADLPPMSRRRSRQSVNSLYFPGSLPACA
jgi:16S rRNA (adenine1518-N6/adenine1519-N6)-dimethyltransferase